jgi:DNA-directed RNA polymerase subunit RPC12/RpoP
MKNEFKKRGFTCAHCKKWVVINEHIGTKNRNHCPHCLWSKHVDDRRAGDRSSKCLGGMQPVGLTFKKAGTDKYGRPRQGELMLVHQCSRCGKISINRIAADDDSKLIMDLLRTQLINDKQAFEEMDINLLSKSDEEQVKVQLFGN